jgi:hypothetical protein
VACRCLISSAIPGASDFACRGVMACGVSQFVTGG